MEWYSFVWIALIIIAFASIVEWLHDTHKKRKHLAEQQRLNEIHGQQFHIYTIATPMSNVNQQPSVHIPRSQQELYEIQKRKEEMDLPPKYEDVIANSSPVAYNSNQVSSDPVRVV